ncbi:HNH endonuclease signature motif containing protein, partial [Mycobacterium sp. GA-2829]|uniref:HNH endonuclease signature motif containing protein n=1 Tax=Mycobacterium sp. GA-2829 TaxID=1772283 RepID=UPI00074050B2
PSTPREAQLEALFDEMSELAGQRNAIDARLVEIAAEIDGDRLWGATGARSVTALVAWKIGCSTTNAKAITAIAERIDEFPLCVQALREGRLSLDQVGVIADKAGPGSDEHYYELAKSASVNQLRTAIRQEPKPKPDPVPEDPDDPPPPPEPEASITTSSDETHTSWHIRLPHAESAKVDAALTCRREGMVAQWDRDHTDAPPGGRPPAPSTVDAFLDIIEGAWDTDAARRPHSAHTTVAVHLDIKDRIAALHLGPLLPDSDQQYLTCDATCEVWFERNGQVIGAGRSTRLINRRLRRALEHRDRTCVVPGCEATRGLHAHHIIHWEDGGETELDNLVLVCPYHHRAHHRGIITITGPADQLVVTDSRGRVMESGSLARPPTTAPPKVDPYPGPSGERADWWWYTPFEPKAPPSSN